MTGPIFQTTQTFTHPAKPKAVPKRARTSIMYSTFKPSIGANQRRVGLTVIRLKMVSAPLSAN